MNMIGCCVVAGNIGGSAEIAFGDQNDTEFLDLKNYEKNPDGASYGWASNNTIFAHKGSDYTEIAKGIASNGEPGVCWLENMGSYSRMIDEPDYKDKDAMGGNPCLEQTLHNFEMCTLVETFPNNHENLDDYLKTLGSAFLYSKTVTLGLSHQPESAKIMAKKRGIGASMSGIVQFLAKGGE